MRARLNHPPRLHPLLPLWELDPARPQHPMPLSQPPCPRQHPGKAAGRHQSKLAEKSLKIEKAEAAVVDATIIHTAGGTQRQALEVDENGSICEETTPGKDKDARWIKKGGKYHPGYRQHTRTDPDGHIEKIHITPANVHEAKHLAPLLTGIAKGVMVCAGKGYDSQENRTCLQQSALNDGIMQKARNGRLEKIRYVVEQGLGTLHRKFRYVGASYFGLGKVAVQSHLKAICLNLLKAGNRIRVSIAA